MHESANRRTRLGRRAADLLAIGACAAAFMLPAGQASATPVASTALVSGQVLDGATAVDGASVTIVAWPNQAALNKLPAGATVPTRTIAATVTDSGGDYAASPDLASLPAMFHEPDGTVNVELDAASVSNWQTWNMPTAAPVAIAAGNTMTAVARVRPATVTFNFGRSTVTTAMAGASRTHPQTAMRLGQQRTGPARRANTVQPDGPPYEGGCDGWVTGAYITNRPERFLNLYAMSQAHATVAERVGSSHTMGVALSYSNGPWGVSGSVTSSTTSSAGGTLSYAANRTLYNSVNYRHYDRRCYHPSSSEVVHEAKPAGFYDLLSTSSAINPMTWTACSAPKASGTWLKSQGTNVEFSTGVSLGFVSVNAQAAFSADTEVTWSPTSSVVICGDTSLGWIKSPQAGVRGNIVTCQPGKPC